MSNVAFVGEEPKGEPSLRFRGQEVGSRAEEPLDLFGLLRVVRRRKILIGCVFAMLLLVSFAAVMELPKTYRAEARLMIQPPLAADLGEESTHAKLNLDVEIARLTARDVSLSVIAALGLDKLPEFNPALREPSFIDRQRARFSPARPASQAADPDDLILPQYFGALSISRATGSDILLIGFTSANPNLAAAAPNMLVDTYLAHRETMLKSRAQSAAAWLDVQITEQRGRLEDARKAARDFREQAGLGPSARDGEGSETITALTERRAGIIRERADVTARLSVLSDSANDERRAALTDVPAITDLRRVLQAQRHDLDQLLETYGNNYAGVREARGQVEETEAAIRDEEKRYAETLGTRLESLRSEEQAVLDGMELARHSLSRQGAAEAEAEGLVRVVDTEQAVLDRLEAQRRTVGVTAELPVAEAEMLAPATVPLGPDGKSRLFYLVIAAVLSGGIAVTVAFAREMLDTSIRSRQQLIDLMPNASAAMLPKLPPRVTRDLSAIIRDPRGRAFADAVRGLTLVLEQGGEMAKSISVVSALPGDGKSFVAGALAAELAAAGWDVLLVDGDLWRGRLHHMFGAKAGPGLGDVFAGKATLEEVTRVDKASGISYITRGSANAALFYEREVLAEIVEGAAKRGQLVIFDTAPLLATTDTTMLSGMTERSVFVLRWGATTTRAVEAALHRLPEPVADRLTAAINGVDPSRHAMYGFHDAQLYGVKLRRYRPRDA